MAFPRQKTLHGELVTLEPITGDRSVAKEVKQFVEAHSDVLERQLPQVARTYNSVRNVRKRHRRLFERQDGEGFVVRDERAGKLGGGVIGQVSLLRQYGVVGEYSAQLDYWIFPDGDRRPVGLEVAKLAIARGFEVCDWTPPHAVLYEDDSIEPSAEFKEFMYPLTDTLPAIGPGHPDWTGVSGRTTATYVARPLNDSK